MTDNSRTRQSLALVGALVMIVSMAALGFAGAASANVQDIGPQGISASDVTAGTSSVDQTVTLSDVENDGSEGFINISNNVADFDNSEVTGASVTSQEGHSASVNQIKSDGTIVVKLASGSASTGDITLNVVLDLSDGRVTDQTVEYTADSESESVSVSDSFDISVPQPEFDSNNAPFIPADNGSLVKVPYDEPVNAASGADESDAVTAFEIISAGQSIVGVNSTESTKTTLALELSGYVDDGQGSVKLEYTNSSQGGADAIGHFDDTDVVAQNETETDVTNNARPNIVSSTLTDNNQVQVTFSEGVQNTNGTSSDVADNFTVNGNTPSGASNLGGSTLTLTLSNNQKPGANLTLDYTGGTDNQPLESSSGPNRFVPDTSGVTVFNSLVPKITQANITAKNPDEVLVTYNGTIADTGVQSDDFSFSASGSLAGVQVDYTRGNNSQLAVINSSRTNASEGDPTLDGTTNIKSDSGVSALSGQTGLSVNNNVVPNFSSATVTNADRDSITVTFQESIQKNVSGENIDSAVTDAFTLQAPDLSDNDDYLGNNEVRIKNVSNIGTDTITLNLGPPDGRTAIDIGDDLSGALSYDPTASELNSGERFPLEDADGTNANVPAFSNEDVTNSITSDFQSAQLRHATPGSDPSVRELVVTFENDITKSGTDSEVENAFSFDSQNYGQVLAFPNDGSAFKSVSGNQVIFDAEVLDNNGPATPGGDAEGFNSTLDLSSDLDFTPSDANANQPLQEAATGDDLGSFSNKDVTNNLIPFVESSEVRNAEPGQLRVTYNENVTESAEGADNRFSSNDVTVDDVNPGEGLRTQIDLVLDSDVSTGDSDPQLTYSQGSPQIQSDTGNNDEAVGQTFTATNNVGSAPTVQSVRIDDAVNNTGADSTKELVVTFSEPVTSTSGDDSDPTDGVTSGLSIDAGLPGVSVTTTGVAHEAPSGATYSVPSDVILVGIKSTSGSTDSMISETDDLSGSSFTVNTPANVDIVSDDSDSNNIQSDSGTTVSNEIAGSLANAGTVTMDVEQIGTEADGNVDSFTVTADGFTDSEGDTVIDTADVQFGIGGADIAGNAQLSALDNINLRQTRFDTDTISVTINDGADINTANVNVGSSATVDVFKDDGSTVSTSSTDSVTFVHEKFTVGSTGVKFESQANPGSLVIANSTKIDRAQQYYPDASTSFQNYFGAGEVDQVHRGIFVNASRHVAEDAGPAEYGYVFDTDRSGLQTNVGEISMSAGWHIVGSNYDISPSGPLGASIQLEEDLQTAAGANSSVVNAQRSSLPGVTLGGEAPITNNETYYVFLQESQNRPVVLPEYNPAS